jgi:hypothetical protein
VVFDLENDGDLDILVVNQKPVLDYPVPSTTRLFRNDAAKGNWLKIALLGTDAEKNGIGSRVKVVYWDTRMIRQRAGGGSSHLSPTSALAHFGRGEATRVDSVIVTWIGGGRQVLLNQNANQMLTITQEKTDSPGRNWLIALLVTGLLLLAYFLIKKRKSGARTAGRQGTP